MFILRVILKSGAALEWAGTEEQAALFLSEASQWVGRKGPRSVPLADGGGYVVLAQEIASVGAVRRQIPERVEPRIEELAGAPWHG